MWPGAPVPGSINLKGQLEAKTVEEKSTCEELSLKHFAFANKLGYSSPKEIIKNSLTLNLTMLSTELKLGHPIILNIEITNISETFVFLPWDIIGYLEFDIAKLSGEKVHLENHTPRYVWDKIPFNILMPGDKWIVKFDLRKFYPMERGLKSKSHFRAFPNISGQFEVSLSLLYPIDLLANSVKIFVNAFGETEWPLNEYIKNPNNNVFIIEAEESITFTIK